MNEVIKMLIVFIISIVVHEFGHYIAFRMNGIKKPKIRFHWFGITVGTEEDMDSLTLHETIDVYLTGIVLGYCVIFVASMLWNITSSSLVFAYLVACFFDFSNIFQVLSLLKKHPELKNLRVDAANVRLAKEIILTAKQKD